MFRRKQKPGERYKCPHKRKVYDSTRGKVVYKRCLDCGRVFIRKAWWR